MRQCMFCKGQALTNEDAWPIWLMKAMPGAGPGTNYAARGEADLEPWRSQKPQQKVKYVCGKCNNGWMSQLENRVKPIVENIFNLNSVDLDSVSQMILAVWSVKSAMVFEALRPTKSWYFLDSERETLMKSLDMPSWTHVWVANCLNYQGVFTSGVDLGGIVNTSSGPVKGFVTTLGFGPLAIQVLNIRFATATDPSAKLTIDRPSSSLDSATLPIWPSQHQIVRWPPSSGLSGESDLEALSKRWVYHHI
jgi:hypothetical protein